MAINIMPQALSIELNLFPNLDYFLRSSETEHFRERMFTDGQTAIKTVCIITARCVCSISVINLINMQITSLIQCL